MMKNSLTGLLVFSAALALIAGCGAKAYSPVPINSAADVCAQCGMTVRDNGYASEIVTKDGKALKFDDVGDLFKYITENTNLDIGEEFVQDRNTKEWLILNKAVLITNTSVRTPMGWGIHAFKTAEEAAKFSASLTNSGNTGTKDKMM